MKTWGIMGLGVAAAALFSGCQCTPPVRECIETAPVGECVQPAPVMEYKQGCRPQTVTVIRRDAACPTLSPVGEITVMRNQYVPRKMTFVSVRPTDDRCYNPESRNFERPWPWGPNNIGSCSLCR